MEHQKPARIGRRMALLGSATLLTGCDTLRDWFDSALGQSKVPLTGDRVPVMAAERGITPDASAANRPFALPAPALNTEWPTAGGNAGHAPGHLSLPSPIGEVWRTSIGSGTGYRQRLTAAPRVVGDTVFAVDAFGWVTALDVARGNRRWQTDTRPRRDRDGAVGGALAYANDTLFCATGLAEIMALDPATGEIRWRAPLPAPARGGIAVAGNRVMVPTIENQLIGLSAEDGARVWTFRATPVQALPLGLPSPAVEGDVAVGGFPSGEIVCFRIADGRVQWSESLGTTRGGVSIADIGAITALPVVDRGRVFAIGMAGAATSLDLRSGRRVWEREVGGTQTPSVAGDWVFALTRGSALMAMTRDEGRVRWITQLPVFANEARQRDPIAWGPPVLAGGRLLITGSHAQLFEVNAENGDILTRLRIPDGSSLQPVVVNNSVYLLTDGGSVVALRGVG
ncbi:PQQ-binding-like beta-propeller repeat protein [Sediminicoccus sp. KRV36]|uniref:outer membrane protein assembly factor BamB family protein n=1 Tax=Sediminicoccus sp. KRV36 TaxID=3133721 RepID=UPI00200F32B1|nr:PQQ-binding-like beta-propeller repeat protein [Sediminicoccus rosea]UPY37863.1 PQQ-binding-like beta-propeller repeat protein [Sediminicoccus rosea]